MKIPSMIRDSKLKYTTKFDDSFRVRAAMLWNTIPAKLTTKSSMESFKNGLTVSKKSARQASDPGLPKQKLSPGPKHPYQK